MLKITPKHQIVIDYFNNNGVELNEANGLLLPIDQELKNKRGSNHPNWSVNVLVLTTAGPKEAYYRHEDKQFTIHDLAPMDIYLKHANMLSNKYITDIDAFYTYYNSI